MWKITLLGLMILAGCAFARSSSYSVEGKNLKTPYGKGDARIHVVANTEFSLFK